MRSALRWPAVALALLLGLVGCGDDEGTEGVVGPDDLEEIPGSGEIVTDIREVSGFDHIELKGEGNVVVAFGDRESLTIEADDNLLAYLETSVEDGRLVIATTAGIDIEPSRTIQYRIEARELRGVALGGVGAIDLPAWEDAALEVVLAGVGDIWVDEVSATSLDVDITGVGSISLAGEVDTQRVSMLGPATYAGGELRSATATVDSTGAGLATLWVSDTLDVRIDGPGDVECYGNPQVTLRGTGPGQLLELGSK